MPDFQCTLWPDRWFGVSITDCCVAHDLGGTDWALAQCIAAKGGGFWLLAAVMLIGLATLGRIYRFFKTRKIVMRTIDEIIEHCSATPEGRNVTVDEIRRWHKAPPRNWRDIGYHFVIYLDGSIHEGRPLEQDGAHARGHNAHSIGICYVGGLDKRKKAKDTRTPAQKAALESLIGAMVARFPEIDKISGHHDYSNKACPCFPARQEYSHFLTEPYRLPSEPEPAAPADYAPPSAPREVDAVLRDSDKPLTRSKTFWGALVAAIAPALSALGDVPQTVSLALIGVGVAAGVYIMFDRRRKAKLARRAWLALS